MYRDRYAVLLMYGTSHAIRAEHLLNRAGIACKMIPVPRHLRDTHYAGAKALGHGEGYVYPHDHPGAAVDQDYLGVDRVYYRPTSRGFEDQIAALEKKYLF